MWEINRESEMTKARRDREYLGILAFNGNQKAHTWNVTLTDEGEPIPPDGKAIQGLFVYEDNTWEDIAGTMTGNVASVVIPATVYQHPGYCRAYMRIFWGVRIVTVDAIVFLIERLASET